jgi:putative CocE/NonD family hydrolase
MRRSLTALALILAAVTPAAARQAQPAPVAAPEAAYDYQHVMIPMRDGARMETVIIRPMGAQGPLPMLLERSPYGIPDAAPATTPADLQYLARDGYIMVYQNMRGRFGSDGRFTMAMALAPKGGKGPDDATDAWDTIDWLVKNVRGNNGRVGMWGVSYPGYAAAVALTAPHPALKAVSPQAGWNDWWINDDLHRFGAIRLSYATDWLWLLQHSKQNDNFPGYDAFDTYDWFLKQGSVADLEARWFKSASPMMTAIVERPDYDASWQRQRWTDALGRAGVATLSVAGFWDQEDPYGPWRIYQQIERDDPNRLNMIVAGPWNHGSWRGAGDRVGPIPIGAESGTAFRRDIEAPFFAYWLHGKGERPAFEARMFQSGSWTWRDYQSWPPKGASNRSLFLRADGSLSFDAPPPGEACRDYVSDPAHPVPYRRRPISSTWGSRDWPWWEADDQRFLGGRPDVLTYVSEPLTSDLTVTGTLVARLMASTSGTDSDFVVKLIDVYPDDAQALPRPMQPGDYARSLNGYQLPIAMEVRRGRWLDGNEVAKPLVPGQVRGWDVPLREHDHVFKQGHRIMVQVQSSWFPVIDRNPQRFVPNIAKAKPDDFVKATQRVCAGSHIALPVMTAP